jgi:hypothetical protein
MLSTRQYAVNTMHFLNFGLRNREPARRVGVRRTISNCEFRKAQGMEHRARSQPFDKLRAGSQNPEFRRKAIKIDFISATLSLNRRMWNKEFRISK